MAELLTHSWRREPSPPSLSLAGLAHITPLLLKTDSAGLGWWRVQQSELRTSAAALRLKHAYIAHVLSAELQEREIVQALGLLRSAGIEPLLGKGWAITRLYPSGGLRSSIDIDLCVRKEQRSLAKSTLADLVAEGCWLDLHTQFRPLDRSVEELFAHSQLARLGETEI